MKYLKYFESERQFREVDLQAIWDNIQKFYSSIIGNDRPVLVDAWFYNKILIPLLQDKEIEFRRAIHPYDSEVIYGLSGRVKKITVTDSNTTKYIRVSLYGDLQTGTSILGSIDTVQWMKNEKNKSLIIKIYDSEPLEVENKMKYLSMESKYNI